MFFNFVGVGHARFGLLARLQLAGLCVAQGLHNQICAQRGQAVMQRGGGVRDFDGHRRQQQHIARVQTRVHLHDGHACLRVSRLNGTVYGRSTTPARQQRRMNVQATQTRRIQSPLRQDQSISGHHHRVSLRKGNGLLGELRVFWVFAIQAQAARLCQRHVVLERHLFDGRGLQFHAAPCGSVGLGQHQHHFVASRHNPLQRGGGKFGRARKNNAH